MRSAWKVLIWDHPRSRGVYSLGATKADGETGSSPLARGLPVQPAGQVADRGIIPARAGFTPSSTPCCPTRRDHPRSRGVYSGSSRSSRSRSGSSPLARGLPAHCAPYAQDDGIIPARAGFTASTCPDAPDASDHPRSRGVYRTYGRVTKNTDGSSPLARGLPVGAASVVPEDGIIPARAGFTARAGVQGRLSEDHPRSRGVYISVSSSTALAMGSSPLARGLHTHEDQDDQAGRIIPARAGFTFLRTPFARLHADHPRSRGVYFLHPGAPFPCPGSSPLARGLPSCSWPRPPNTRIIPARAGFTAYGTPTWTVTADHPRSRGVYSRSAASGCPMPGSSPLARGLLKTMWVRPFSRRIIPARAGFTA